MSLLLGIDLGTSAVKAALLDAETGVCVASSVIPDQEIPRSSPEPGWTEQSPDDWWDATCAAILSLPAELRSRVTGIGIAYQMHGLVLIDRNGEAVRPAIIWSDGRALSSGEKLLAEIGSAAAKTLLNRPGNFTASKLRWVRDSEPENFNKVWKAMLPGDYIAYRLSGQATTTSTGLSEMIAWDYEQEGVSKKVWSAAGGTDEMLPSLVPIFGEQGHLASDQAKALGLPAGVSLCYRAGDQPNNALSLNVLEPGEVAATVGTSGVLYGVTEKIASDPRERVNTFLHVNHKKETARLGVLSCVNGAGSFYSWVRRALAAGSFQELNVLAEKSEIGARGLLALPYGNGPERSLGNKGPGAQFVNIDVNRHSREDMARASQEGIVFAMRLGAEVFGELGQKPTRIRAGTGNMFKSPLFCQTFADNMAADLELYETDGAVGAARGAGIGAGLFGFKEAFRGLEKIATYRPDPATGERYRQVYGHWKQQLDLAMENL